MDYASFVPSPAFIIVGLAAIGGWVVTTWLRMRHGYPLEGTWGQEIKPVTTNETTERLRLVTQENAQMAAELGALKDRVQTLERIATDSGTRLANEIDGLRH